MEISYPFSQVSHHLFYFKNQLLCYQRTWITDSNEITSIFFLTEFDWLNFKVEIYKHLQFCQNFWLFVYSRVSDYESIKELLLSYSLKRLILPLSCSKKLIKDSIKVFYVFMRICALVQILKYLLWLFVSQLFTFTFGTFLQDLFTTSSFTQLSARFLCTNTYKRAFIRARWRIKIILVYVTFKIRSFL